MGKKFAAFIDRDGTINLDVGNLSKVKDLIIPPKVPAALILLNKFNIPAIVITNQSVVARGLLIEEGVEAIHREIKQSLAKEGAKIDAFYFCPHHPNANLEKYRVVCDCRKPGTGMYKKAAKEFGVDLKYSYVIGDSFRDIEAGKTLGATTIAVSSNQTELRDSKPDYLVKDLYEAVKLILQKEKLK